MPLRRLIFLATVVLAVVGLSPSAALAAANGTSRPLTGTATGTSTVNLLTGATTVDATGHLSHLGAVTGHFDLTTIPTSTNTFTAAGTGTDVAANGDKLFLSLTAAGTFTPTTAEATNKLTITGGTGRFAGASGMSTETVSLVVVSVTATSQTSRFTATFEGQISY